MLYTPLRSDMFASLIFVLVAQDSHFERPTDDIVSISTKAYDIATNAHFTSLVKRFNFDGYFSRPRVAFAPKANVDIELLRAYIEPTGLPISLDGNLPGYRESEVVDFIWDGSTLKSGTGNLLPFDGEMIMSLVKRVRLRTKPGEILGIQWTVRQYLKEVDQWSDSIMMTVFGENDWMSIEVNDHATTGRAYRPVAAQFGTSSDERLILELTPSGWVEAKR
jgi:hypothetical protein